MLFQSDKKRAEWAWSPAAVPGGGRVRPPYTALLIALALLFGVGCKGAKKTPVPSAQLASSEDLTAAAQSDPPDSTAARDAQPNVPMVFRLVCYQLAVPAGTVSRNEEFWKPIDETCVDPARYDLLRRNGIRIGEAANAEFEKIHKILEQNPGTGRSMGTIGPEASNLELEMRKSVPYQNISYYGNSNGLSTKTYEHCDNILNLSYQRAPRKIGEMRLAITPMVRLLKSRPEYTSMNNEMQIQYVASEKFYLNMIVDLPMNKFLIVAPSDSSQMPTVIGHQFFIRDDPAEEMEQVLIFIAQPLRVGDDRSASN